MSLLDLFLSQGIIAVSLVAALVPLLVAAGLFLAPRLRRWNAERSAARAAIQAERALLAQAEAEARMRMAEPEAIDEEEAAPRRVRKLPAEAEAPHRAKPAEPLAKPAPTPAPVPVPAPAASSVPAQTPAPESAAATTSTPATSGDVSSGMQDLLSSVFADEGHNQRYAALLAGLDTVNIQELAALTQQVAGQLQGEGQG
jgi:outer membrane biosynthesis protein TonB